mgnify:CR=1 FL=1
MVLDMNDVEGLRQGDRSCFENIFNKYSPDLYVVAYRVTGNKSMAEDLVQDFFVKLWVNRERLSIYKSFRYYCFSAIHYASLNAMRTKYRDTQLSEDFEDPFQVEYEMEQAELREKIRLAVDSLPEKCRAIFLDACIEEHSYVEIAQKYNISINTVKVQVSKAYRILREKLTKEQLFIFLLIFLKSK